MFLFQKNPRSVFNENTDQFLFKKISHLYLMKIQISFIQISFYTQKKKKKDLYLMKIQINLKKVFSN